MDSGDVGMIMAVQKAIDSDEDEHAGSDEIWGGKEWLDPRLVKEGRLDEMTRLKHFDVPGFSAQTQKLEVIHAFAVRE